MAIAAEWIDASKQRFKSPDDYRAGIESLYPICSAVRFEPSQLAIDFASASSDRPQRLGAVDTSAKQGTEMEQAQSSRGDTSYPVQTIPSISPQTWIR